MTAFFSRYLWCLVAGAAVLYLAFTAAPAHDADNAMRIQELAVCPVQAEGRAKPLDSYARTILTQISSRQTFRDFNEDGETLGPEQPAVRWLLDAIISTPRDPHDRSRGPGDDHPVFRVDNGELLNFLHLKMRPEFLRYSIREIAQGKAWGALADKATRVHRKDEKDRDLFDQKLLELAQHLQLYIEVTELRAPRLVPPQVSDRDWRTLQDALREGKVFRVDNPDLRKLLGVKDQPADARFSLEDFGDRRDDLDAEAKKAAQKIDGNTSFSKLSAFEQDSLNLEIGMQAFLGLKESPVPKVLDLDDPNHPATMAIWKILSAYKRNDVASFNAEVSAYRDWLEANRPAEMRSARFETFFNNFAPFYRCAVLYVVVFLLTVVSWVAFSRPLTMSALALAVVVLVVHTFALCARMYILDRPFVFVINLYSTAIFIGWVCLIVGLLVEVIYRNGIGLYVASVIGFLTMIVAHGLAAGDTLEMMRAVLDTNFWLATHVTMINIGYAATMFAGVLGSLFILRGVLTPKLDRPMVKTLGDMTYGVLCFATLASFIGTVLGGIWADQSWGRFWGWDPKENGALMIVIWNALILHARWGGMVKQRGVAVLCLVGNIITIWSWFGVNLLGIGLHSYGFNSGTFWWIVFADAIHGALILVGLIPMKWWMSYAAMTAPPPVAQAPRPVDFRPRSRRGNDPRFAPAT